MTALIYSLLSVALASYFHLCLTERLTSLSLKSRLINVVTLNRLGSYNSVPQSKLFTSRVVLEWLAFAVRDETES